MKILFWLASAWLIPIAGFAELSGTPKAHPTESKQPYEKRGDSFKPTPDRLGLDQIPEWVRRNNPDLIAARELIHQARARLRQAGRLTNPEWITSLDQDPHSRERSASIGFQQAFPVTSRLKLEKEVAATEVTLAEAEVLDGERRIIAETRSTAVEYLEILQQLSLRREQHLLAEDLYKYSASIALKGEGSSLDTAQARLEAGQHLLEIHRLELAGQTTMALLKPLLGIRPEQPFSLEGELPQIQVPTQVELNLQNRPDYRAAELAVTALAQSVKLEKARKWGDMTTSLFMAFSREEDQPNGLESEKRIGFQISIPLPLWNNHQGAIEERRSLQTQAEFKLRALENRLRSEYHAAWQALKAQASLAQEIRDQLLPQSVHQVETTTAAYRNGQVDLLTVLHARNQSLQLQAAEALARRNFYLALIQYESSLGIIP